jgi:phosphatidylserine/phosphatidylglycerophosphate/cardiolipin synthase-like enzyme
MNVAAIDEVISDVARSLPLDQLNVVAAFLETQDEPSDAVVEDLKALVPNPGFAAQVGALTEAWKKQAGVTGETVALALRSTGAAVDRARREQRIETVWTGPTTKEVPLRQTLGVLLQVVKSARERLVIVSFAAYKIADVVDALRDAAARDVAIVVVIDEATDAGNAFSRLAGAAQLYCWPAAGMLLPNGGKVRMHVKAAVADDHTALVGSANLTGQALSENMELGLLVEGGDIPRRLDAHFRGLIAAEVLVPVGGSSR